MSLDFAAGAGYHNILSLTRLSLGYLTATDLDAQRQAVRDWAITKAEEQSIIDALDIELEYMPKTSIWGIATHPIVGGFRQFRGALAHRQVEMAALSQAIQGYEGERAEYLAEQELLDELTFLSPEAEFALGFNDVADIGFILRDYLVTGELDPTVALSILPFIPHKALSTLGRFASRIPGLGALGRAGRQLLPNAARVRVNFAINRLFGLPSVESLKRELLDELGSKQAVEAYLKGLGKPHEIPTALRLRQQEQITGLLQPIDQAGQTPIQYTDATGRRVSRLKYGDFYDPLTGVTYDPVTATPSRPRFDLEVYIRSVDNHIRTKLGPTTGIDNIVVDVSEFVAHNDFESAKRVYDHVDANFPGREGIIWIPPR